MLRNRIKTDSKLDTILEVCIELLTWFEQRVGRKWCLLPNCLHWRKWHCFSVYRQG